MSETEALARAGGRHLVLKNHGDGARVVFMGFVQSEWKTGDDKGAEPLFHDIHFDRDANEYSECPRPIGGLPSECPLCQSGNKSQVRVAMSVWNVDLGAPQVFDLAASFVYGSRRSPGFRPVWEKKRPEEWIFIVQRQNEGRATQYTLIPDERISDDLLEAIMSSPLFTSEEKLSWKEEPDDDGQDEARTDDEVPF